MVDFCRPGHICDSIFPCIIPVVTLRLEMNNFQGDITKTRDLLPQAVQYLDHVTYTLTNTHGNRSSHMQSTSNVTNTSTNTHGNMHRSGHMQTTSSGTYPASNGNSNQFPTSSDTFKSIGGRSRGFINRGTPYPSAERRALFRPNQYVQPAFNPSSSWRHNLYALHTHLMT